MIELNEKIRMINERINNINFHILGLEAELEEEVRRQDVIDDFIMKKNAMQNHLDLLTNSI